MRAMRACMQELKETHGQCGARHCNKVIISVQVGEYAGEVGEYLGDAGDAGDVGEYLGDVGENDGDDDGYVQALFADVILHSTISAGLRISISLGI